MSPRENRSSIKKIKSGNLSPLNPYSPDINRLHNGAREEKRNVSASHFGAYNSTNRRSNKILTTSDKGSSINYNIGEQRVIG